ncbi:MAG: domain containing protein [Fibrobacteres bacterium]|nr:domain containing protein [Fibrobacterota bacterium]
MAKIVIRYQNQILGEAQLRPGFNTIGRLPAHPICIENLGISRNHAFIIGDIEEKIFILEDLQSLNGTYVNKKRVHKCLLKSNDVITIGQHALEYLEDVQRPRELPAPVSQLREPFLEAMDTGKSIPLAKETTYFGNSSSDDIHIPGLMIGKQFASIDRKGTVWVINLLVKRFSHIKLNGEEVNSARLKDGDEIEVGGVGFRFLHPG